MDLQRRERISENTERFWSDSHARYVLRRVEDGEAWWTVEESRHDEADLDGTDADQLEREYQARFIKTP